MSKYVLSTHDLLTPPYVLPVVFFAGLAVWLALRPYLG